MLWYYYAQVLCRGIIMPWRYYAQVLCRGIIMLWYYYALVLCPGIIMPWCYYALVLCPGIIMPWYYYALVSFSLVLLCPDIIMPGIINRYFMSRLGDPGVLCLVQLLKTTGKEDEHEDVLTLLWSISQHVHARKRDMHRYIHYSSVVTWEQS
jgi:hypothetical protein